MNASNVPPYPLKHFHLIIHDAALEMHQNVKAPDALVGMAFLTAIAVACQGLIDVRLPTGQIRPVSLNLVTIAESGERKSVVEGLTSAPIYEHDELCAKKYIDDIAEYQIEFRFWKSVNSGINREIIKLTQKGESVDAQYQKLKEHAAKTPIKPRLRRTIRQNTTEKAIMEALQGNGESIALISDEGEIILKSGAMNQTGTLNKGWDGGPLTFDRGDAESLIASNPRLTVSFMVQPVVFQDFHERHGNVTRGSGHWARYLVGWPDSTQGVRFMSYEDAKWIHLPKFHARVTELIEEYGRLVEAGEVERKVVEFSEEAKMRWIDLVNVTESWLQPWGYLKDMKDFASKAMEIVGRVAALLHWFSKQEGKISVDTFERAHAIVEWHLHEFKRIFPPQSAMPTVQVDAQKLGRYLQSHYAQNGFTTAPKNDVLNKGPIRPRNALEAALDYLAAQGHIYIWVDIKRKRFINLHSPYFVIQAGYPATSAPLLGRI